MYDLISFPRAGSILTLAILLMTLSVRGQHSANYDEDKVPVYEVSDVLTTFKGEKVRDMFTWFRGRRPELLRFFEQNVYGAVPGQPDSVGYKTLEQSPRAFHGTAKRKQVEVTLYKNRRKLSFTILCYLPDTTESVPLILGYNFYGNHTVTADPKVIVPTAWTRNNAAFGITDNTPTEASRGVRSGRWPIEKILANGFGLGTIYYGEVDPDKNDFTDGIHPLFYEAGQERPKANEWGSIAAWAFGLGKALDYLGTDSDVDASKVVVFGHSRLGKTALWAAATDMRFAGAISNDSGCGGAALSKRRYGETLAVINSLFPHWFCNHFKRYNNREDALPTDQHGLLALIAPRPLYVASAQDDRWADPKGEYLAAYYASPVYNHFGITGLSSPVLPLVETPVLGELGYHIRKGAHDVMEHDWDRYLTWARAYIGP